MGLVSIAQFMYVHEAQLAKSLLEAEGIHAFIANENIATQNWLYTNAVGGIRLEVAEENAEAAKELLAGANLQDETKGELGAGNLISQETEDVCPECGSDQIKYEVTGKWGILVSWLALGSPVFPLGKRLRCEKCGVTWKK